MAKKNILTQGKKTRADQLALANRLDEALALYAGVCKTDPMDVEARVKLSVTQRRLGHLNEAEASARRAVLLAPGLAFAHHALGAALQGLGKLEEAILSYRQAARLKPDYADCHYLLGNCLMENGSLQEAEEALRRAIGLRVGFFEALSDLGALLLMMGRGDEGAAVLQQALALRPDSPEVLANLANLLEMDERVEEAIELYQRALGARPDSPDVLAKKAELLEKSGRLEEARRDVEAGLGRFPDHPLLNLVAARIARRDGRHAEAANQLEGLLALPMAQYTRGEIHLLLGQLRDRLGQHDAVLAHLMEGKRLTAAAAADREGRGRQRFLDKIQASRAWVTDRLAAAPRPAPVAEAEKNPIFLIGFPRSGTTLLEQILDSHPRLQTLEEKPTAGAVEQAFLGMVDGTDDPLASLTDDGIAKLRKVYWQEVDRHVIRRPGARLVDKLPLNTVRVPLLWRIFPEAHFILAIRHPCDVTLSCLMQNFGANDAMAGFVSLESVAGIYAEVMAAWRFFADRLPLKWHRIRYEDLVSDFEPEARRLLEFLEVGWDEAVLDHTRRAQQRAVINTPSYHQVTQPIYQHAKYRWKRYAREFAPVMATLAPFVEHFGYGESGEGQEREN